MRVKRVSVNYLIQVAIAGEAHLQRVLNDIEGDRLAAGRGVNQFRLGILSYLLLLVVRRVASIWRCRSLVGIRHGVCGRGVAIA